MKERIAKKRVVPTDAQIIDAAFLVRLFLGAQSEHEQRLIAVRLLRQDENLRKAMVTILEPFEMFDLDLLAEYEQVLRENRHKNESASFESQNSDPNFEDPNFEDPNFKDQRHRILRQAFARVDLDQMLLNFTYYDLLQLGEATRKLFSWSMAEMLLQRTSRVGVADYEIHTNLYLAVMIIDVVEILGVAGRAPEFPAVVSDVRRRIANATKASPRSADGSSIIDRPYS